MFSINDFITYLEWDLNLESTPRIVYTKLAKSSGTYYPLTQTVLINTDMDFESTCMTIAHEFRHHWQWITARHNNRAYKKAYMDKYCNSKDYDYSNDPLEVDAFEYEITVYNRFLKFIS